MAVTHETWHYRDAHGVPIFAQAWLPAAPRAAVQVLHGISEHSGRYAGFAEVLAGRGMAVYAADHRGHGRTALAQYGGDRSRFGELGPGGLRATEAALALLTAHIRRRHPRLGVGAFAHSWGSLMAQRIINRERLWDAVVLSGTAYRTPRSMETGSLGARFPGPTGHEWLSRDETVAERYAADPLTYRSNIRRQLGVRDSLRLLGVPGRRVAPDAPILIIGGGDDALNLGDGRERLAAAYRACGVRDVTLRIYPEARHELINELNAEEAIATIADWLLARLTARRPHGRDEQHEAREQHDDNAEDAENRRAAEEDCQ